MYNAAWYAWQRGDIHEAESLAIASMKARGKLLGAENHPDTLTSMNNLAFTWKGQNRDVEAIGLMQQCVQLRLRKLGAAHPYTISSLATLAD
ncbi:hypothetical protein EJ04DRAFT_441738 [Polyplosphaeria fusca]|uniref:Kinesin light chain n=1 Tax=Polyplosphaeria fusca TaxID=682080 RepID=A0A9P4QQU2_9PLEO|nr:hypothetical protein EJ04DRAFT_441738 [Polyplosphaeria fusca]